MLKPMWILSAGVLRRNTSAMASSTTSICPRSNLSASFTFDSSHVNSLIPQFPNSSILQYRPKSPRYRLAYAPVIWDFEIDGERAQKAELVSL